MQLSRIPYGNDFDIRIIIVQPQYTVEGTIWEDFDLTVCSNIKVALVCEKHRVVIPLNWHIEENTNNIIIANVIAKQLHIGTIYGVEVTGLDANGRAWRFKNADVFGVVDQTKNSLMNAEIMSDPLEINADIGLAINVTPIPVTGPQGPMGMQGPEGERGHIGPQGHQGEQGQVGPQGDIGDRGIGVTSVGYIGEDGLNKHYAMNYGDGEWFDWWVADGYPGPQGPQGPAGQDGTVSFDNLTPEQRESLRGPQGNQGEQGEVGPQGYQGEQGEIGAPLTFDDLTQQQKEQLRGEVGPQGPQGNIGVQGNRGVQGPKGEQGSIGLTGPQGERGVQGEIGATGPQGADGNVTFDELTPAQKAELMGPVGPQGDQGVQGPQGNQGIKGADGNVSFDNLTPEQRESLRGPQGVQGSIGNAFTYSDFTPEQLAALTGPQGNQGEQGATGPQGADGSVSFDDLTPSQKEQLKGDPGPQGSQGSKGDAFEYSDFTPEQLAALTGPQGPQGEAGQDGQAGVQGPQGNQGSKGDAFTYSDFTQEQLAALTGPQGNQGPAGPQGDQGPQGAGVDSLDKYVIDTIYDEPNSRLYIYLRTASPDGTIYQPNTLTLTYPNQYADIRTNKNLFYSVYINGTSVNTNTFNNAVQKTGRDTYLSLPATIGNITVDKNSIIQFRICRYNPFNSDPHDIINVVLDSKYNVIGNTLGLKIDVVSSMPASPDANTLYVVV